MSEEPIYSKEAQDKQAVAHYLMRAKAYMQLERWADAKQELNEALLVAPNNADTLFAYAYYHFRRWQTTGAKSCKAEAMRLGTLAVEARPSYTEAWELLEQIKQYDTQYWLTFWLRRILAILVVPAMALLAVLFLQEEGWVNQVSSGLEGAAYKVPAYFEASKKTQGIDLSINTFYIKHGDQTHNQKHLDYSYTGVLYSDSLSIERLSCQILFMGEDGTILAQEPVWFIKANSQGQLNTFKLYPGDRYFFHHKQRWGLLHLPEPARITQVVFRPENILLTQSDSVPQITALPYTWQGPLPKGLEMQGFLREDSLHLEPLDSVAVHFLQMEFTHLGKKPCQELTLLFSWKDAQGKEVKTTDIQVVTPQNKPWLPGQRLAIGWQEFFNSGEHHYPKPYDYFYVQAKATAGY